MLHRIHPNFRHGTLVTCLKAPQPPRSSPGRDNRRSAIGDGLHRIASPDIGQSRLKRVLGQRTKKVMPKLSFPESSEALKGTGSNIAEKELVFQPPHFCYTLAHRCGFKDKRLLAEYIDIED